MGAPTTLTGPQSTISVWLLVKSTSIGPSSFTPELYLALQQTLATMLVVPTSTLTVSGAEATYDVDLPRLLLATTARSLQGNIIGYRFMLTINAAAASSSTVVATAASDLSGIGAAVQRALAARIADGTFATTIAQVAPSATRMLGFASAADLTRNMGTDPSRSVTTVYVASSTTTSPAFASAGLDTGASVGIAMAAIIICLVSLFCICKNYEELCGSKAASKSGVASNTSRSYDEEAASTVSPIARNTFAPRTAGQ
jgi:hypothetical protein